MNDYITFDWKITNLEAVDNVIKSAKYYAKISYENITIDTEGYCYFNGFGEIPIEEVKEETVIGWIKEIHGDGEVCFIEERLKDQLKSVLNKTEIDFPWKPKTFKLNI